MGNNSNLPNLPTGEELEAQPKPFLEKDEWMDATVEEELLDESQDYPIRYTLSINGTPFAPLGGIHGMTGQPGHGKTMTLSMVAAAVLGDTSHGMEWLLKDEIPNPVVLYIDTEMERGNTKLVQRRICAMLGRNDRLHYDDLFILCLREVTTAEERWRKVLKAIYQFKPTVVILDGLIDVVADFNDNVNCQELIFKCMATASHYGVSFWTLLHENPGSEKMVGHAGSFLERKASDVMVTKKIKDDVTGDVKFEVKNKKVRSKDWQSYLFKINDAPPFTFGVPELIDNPTPEESNNDNSGEIGNMTYEQLYPLQVMITDRNGLSTRDMLTAAREHFEVSQSKALKILDDAVSKGVLFRSVNKRYYIPNGNEQGEADF